MTAKTAKLAFPEAETPEDGNTQKNKNTHTTEAPSAPLTARQRMVVAQRVIDGMPFSKDLSNSQYKSIPIDAMRAAVRKACIEAGLTHELTAIEYTREIRGSGTYFYEGRAVMRFTSVDDPEDYIDHPTLGSAMDNGDKGIGKLVTNLIKNAYKETFDIGERGKDDIDAYANEDIESEAERIEAIRARRAKNQEAAKQDRFFGDPLSPLRRRVGQLKADPNAAQIVDQYKADFGELPTWSKECLEKCIRESEDLVKKVEELDRAHAVKEGSA